MQVSEYKKVAAAAANNHGQNSRKQEIKKSTPANPRKKKTACTFLNLFSQLILADGRTEVDEKYQ